jgi:hypothetical protein
MKPLISAEKVTAGFLQGTVTNTVTSAVNSVTYSASGGVTGRIGTGGIDAWGTVAAGIYDGGKLAVREIERIATRKNMEKLAAMFGRGEEAAYLNKTVDVKNGEAGIGSLLASEESAAIAYKYSGEDAGNGVVLADALISAAKNNDINSISRIAEELERAGYGKEVTELIKGMKGETEGTSISGANPYAGHEGSGVIAGFSLGSGAVLAAIYNSLSAEAYSGMKNSPGVRVGAGTADGPQVSIGAETAGMSVAKFIDPVSSGKILDLTSAQYGNLMASTNMPTGYAFNAAVTIPFGDAMTGFNAGMETSLDGSINKLVLSGKAAFPVTPNASVGLNGSYQWDKSTVKIGAGLETKYGSFGMDVERYLNDPNKNVKANLYFTRRR